MKKNKLLNRLIISIVVLGLCITAIQISAISINSNLLEKNTSIKSSISISKYKSPFSKTLTEINIDMQRINSLNLNGNIPIISADVDSQNPAVATDGSNILVMCEGADSFLEADLFMVYSSDNGDTWSEIGTFITEDVVETLPVVDYCENTEFQAYGTCLPDSEGKLYLIHFPSMTDPEASWGDTEGWTIWETTLDFLEYYGMDIAGHPPGDIAPAPNFHGVLTLTGEDPTYGVILENFYETEGTSIGACYLPFEGELGDTISVDIDVSAQRYFEAMELKNEPDLIEDGVFLEHCWVEPGNENWWENDWPVFVIEGAQNPDIAADNGYCYCVYELDGDILCYYSDDNGESFQESTVATDGQFPSVTSLGEIAVCIFSRDNNLYVAISEDGGVTWEELLSPINDENGCVIEDDHSFDVADSFIAWTDDRNSPPFEIFFDRVSIGDPPSAPTIDGPSQGDSGAILTYTFNAVDPEGSNVRYIINWGDGNTETTGFSPSGTDKTVTHTWGPGGTYIIRAKAENSNGLIGTEETFEVVIPRDRVRFLQLFDILPNLYRLIDFLMR